MLKLIADWLRDPGETRELGSVTGRQGWRHELKSTRTAVDETRGITHACLREVYAFQTAADRISERYFDGHTVLFQAESELVAEIVAECEARVEGYNRAIRRFVGEGIAVDPGEVRKAAEPGACEIVRQVVKHAKIDALRNVGEERAALDLLASGWAPG